RLPGDRRRAAGLRSRCSESDAAARSGARSVRCPGAGRCSLRRLVARPARQLGAFGGAGSICSWTDDGRGRGFGGGAVRGGPERPGRAAVAPAPAVAPPVPAAATPVLRTLRPPQRI